MKIIFIFALFVVIVSAELNGNGSENAPPDEGPRIAHIGQIFSNLMDSAAKSGDHWLRNAHAKGHACVRARLNVTSNLSPELQQGRISPPR